MTTHVLALRCADTPGIVARVSTGLHELGANIVENAQFTDPVTGTFCMRTVFDVDIETSDGVTKALAAWTDSLDAQMWLRRLDDAPNIVIMVSKYDHCLLDLLYRHHSGELQANIIGIVSNHQDMAPVAERAGIPYHHIPVTADTKPQAEEALLAIVDEHDVKLVVLARYMQILGDEFCRQLSGRIINIHHSFLPGFKGAKPYHQAWARGVKLIGATAHYVTADLDEGPIITQDVRPVSHMDTPEDMVVVGRDIERDVLSAAVKAHLDEKVFLVTDRTVVFA
ncbi:MAG: formyltetrahydrofolate deformylase [Acidimicrobiales bacterium]|jgi:formyltetrahydrofolate deformylase